MVKIRRGGGRARFQAKPERPSPPSGGRRGRHNDLVRGKPSKPISASAHSATFRTRPTAMDGRVGLRPGLLPQVARKRAVLDAGGSSPVRHEGRFTDTPPGLAMELPRHASRKGPQAAVGTLSPCRWALSLPVSGRRPVKPSRGDAESAMPPFGSGRPVRPCVVVNPGGGWASWPQPSSENNSPALRAFLADKFFSLPGSPRCCDRCAVRPAIPAGRITTRTHWRDLVQPERRNHHG